MSSQPSETTAVQTMLPMFSGLNGLRDECHANALVHGFWDALSGPYETPAKLMLIVSEVSEAMEADRKNDLKGVAEELADVLIRVFDLAGALHIDLDEIVRHKMEVNRARPPLHGKRY